MKIKRWKLGFNLLMLTGLAGGCASMGDFADERLLTARFTSGANQAFGSYEATQGAPIPCRNHFADGFKAGYLDVANGGKGCPPVVPPKRYWSACYMTPKGQQAAQQWFAGFRAGADSAKASGIQQYSQIATSLPVRPQTGYQNMMPVAVQPAPPTTTVSAQPQLSPLPAPTMEAQVPVVQTPVVQTPVAQMPVSRSPIPQAPVVATPVDMPPKYTSSMPAAPRQTQSVVVAKPIMPTVMESSPPVESAPAQMTVPVAPVTVQPRTVEQVPTSTTRTLPPAVRTMPPATAQKATEPAPLPAAMMTRSMMPNPAPQLTSRPMLFSPSPIVSTPTPIGASELREPAAELPPRMLTPSTGSLAEPASIGPTGVPAGVQRTHMMQGSAMYSNDPAAMTPIARPMIGTSPNDPRPMMPGTGSGPRSSGMSMEPGGRITGTRR